MYEKNIHIKVERRYATKMMLEESFKPVNLWREAWNHFRFGVQERHKKKYFQGIMAIYRYIMDTKKDFKTLRELEDYYLSVDNKIFMDILKKMFPDEPMFWNLNICEDVAFYIIFREKFSPSG